MTKPSRSPFTALIALLFIALAPATLSAAELPTAPLDIVTADGKSHHFTVEIADTPDERETGLMNREQLAADAGMLFDFKSPEDVAFWMKNTLIPLDMLFIDKSGHIVTIAERTVPNSLTPIGSAKPVRAVLEVNGGTAARLGIKPGDKILEAIFAH